MYVVGKEGSAWKHRSLVRVGGGGSSIRARTEGRHHMQISAHGKVDGFVRPTPLIFRNRSSSISSLGWHVTRVAIAIRWDKCNVDCLQRKVREESLYIDAGLPAPMRTPFGAWPPCSVHPH